MSQYFTKRNHYNPCFWTACWNPDFLGAVMNDLKKQGDARQQTVYSLNLRSNIIRQTTVDDVFFQKNLGIAKISPESIKQEL
jgi:hypothetical protein